MDNGSAAIAAVAGQALHSRSWPLRGQWANAPEATGMTGFGGRADIVSGRCPASAASVGPMTAPQGAGLTHPTRSRPLERYPKAILDSPSGLLPVRKVLLENIGPGTSKLSFVWPKLAGFRGIFMPECLVSFAPKNPGCKLYQGRINVQDSPVIPQSLRYALN